MPEKSSNVASASGTVEAKRPYQRLIDHLGLLAEAHSGVTDGDAIAADIMDRMLESGSLEDAIAIQDAGLPSGQDMVDVEQLVRSFTVHRSDRAKADHSLGFYLRIDAVRIETGEEINYAVGARNVVVLLIQAMQQGRLPLECVIRSRSVENGDLLTLQLLPKRAVKVSAE